MSQQHHKWIELVKERIEKRGWSQTDLAIVVGVSPSAITQLLKDGKGSDDLKLRINKKLRINESWEKFEEQEGKGKMLITPIQAKAIRRKQADKKLTSKQAGEEIGVTQVTYRKIRDGGEVKPSIYQKAMEWLVTDY